MIKYLRILNDTGKPIAEVEFRHDTFPELDNELSSRAMGEALIASNVEFDVDTAYTIIVSKEQPTNPEGYDDE